DVERNTEEEIGAALVELAGEPAAGHVELKKGVAGRQLHPRDVRDVPGGYQQASRIRVAPQFLQDLGDLIDVPAVGRRPGAPLVAVHRPQVAALVRPFVPDADTVFTQIGDVGVAPQEPQQLVDDRFQVDALGRDEWKAEPEIETQLRPEYAQRPRSGAVAFADPVIQDVLHEVQVLAHLDSLP